MAGIDYSKLHESESVRLLLGRSVPVYQLRATFIWAGFVEDDNFFYLPRQDAHRPWQSDSIVTADFFDGNTQVDFDGVCDRVSFSYLFASLPAEHIASFISVLDQICRAIGGDLEHRGERVGISTLRLTFESYLRDLRDEVSEVPGSETLAILIQDSYPRR